MLLTQLGKDQQAYQVAFALSSILRGLVVVGLIWLPIIRMRVKPMALRSIGMRAGESPLDEPVFPSIKE